MRKAIITAVFVCAALCLWSFRQADEAPSGSARYSLPAWTPAGVPPTARSETLDPELAAKLAGPATLDVTDMPLLEVLDQLAAKHCVEIVRSELLANKKLFGTENPITCNLFGMTLAELLDTIAEVSEPQLIIKPTGEEVIVALKSTPTTAARPLTSRTYILPPELLGQGYWDETQLAKSIERWCSPGSWKDLLGLHGAFIRVWTPGSTTAAGITPRGVIRIMPGALAIVQTPEVHADISNLLDHLVQVAAAPNATKPIWLGRPPEPTDDAVRLALQQLISLDANEEPLWQSVERIALMQNIPVVLDHRALAAKGVSPNRPITIQLNDVAVDSVFGKILTLLDLSRQVRGGVLWITGKEGRNEPLLRLYPVGDLAEMSHEINSEVIQLAISPDGFWGHKRRFLTSVHLLSGIVNRDNCFIVWQTPEAHRQIEELLSTLRRAYDPSTPPSPTIRIWPEPGPIEAVLRRKTTLEFTDLPLGEVVEQIACDHAIKVERDVAALFEVGIPVDVRVNCKLIDEPLERALEVLLEPLDLAVVVRDDRVVVTTVEKAEEEEYLGIYDVRHLLDMGLALPRHTAREYDYDSIKDLVTSLAAPTSWPDGTGPGPGTGLAGLLMFPQTRQGHREIEAVLAALTKLQDDPDRTTPIPIDVRESRLTPHMVEILNKSISIDYDGVSLRDVAAELTDKLGLPVRCDDDIYVMSGLSDSDLDQSVTSRLQGVPAFVAIKSILRSVGMDLVDIQPAGGELNLVEEGLAHSVRIYPVNGWPPDRSDDYEQWESFLRLIGRSENPAFVDKQTDSGSAGIQSCTFFGPTVNGLVVDADIDAHFRIERMLGQLRTGSPAGEPTAEPLFCSPERQRIEHALAQNVTIEFDGASLEAAVRQIGRQFGTNIILARSNLEQVEINVAAPIHCQLRDVPLETALRRLLHEMPSSHDLAVVVEDDVVVVTATQADIQPLELRCYDARELTVSASLQERYGAADETGGVLWGGSSVNLRPRPLNRTRPLEFSRLIARSLSLSQPLQSELGPVISPSRDRDVMLLACTRDEHRRFEAFLAVVRREGAELPSPDEVADGLEAAETARILDALQPDRDPAVRAYALYLAGHAASPPDEWVEPVLDIFFDPRANETYNLRDVAYATLEHFGPRAGRAAEAIAENWPALSTRGQRNEAIRILGFLGRDAADPLCRILDNSDGGEIATAVFTALAGMRQPVPRAVPTLLDCFDWEVSDDLGYFVVLETLAAVDPEGNETRRVLAERMNDADPAVRERAFELNELVRRHFGDPY